MTTFFSLPRNRFDTIIALVCVAFLAQVFISYRLWEPSARQFPVVPVFDWLSLQVGSSGNVAMFALLVGSTVVLAFASNKKYPLVVWLALMTLFVLQDILRLQAWAYQYILMFAIAIAYYQNPDKYGKGVWWCWRLLFAATYFWSGAHKLNPHFAYTVYPWLVGIFKITAPLAPYAAGAYLIAVAEIILALALLWQRSRRIGLWGLLGLHTGILIFLIADGWNLVVYPWNALMILLGWLLFSAEAPESENTVRIARFTPFYAFVFLCIPAPAMQIIGWWEYNMSFTMYSGLCMEGFIVFNLDSDASNCVPRKVRNEISSYSDTQGIFLLDDWTMYELNVPTYPSESVLRRTANKLCDCTYPHGGLIVLKRPFRTAYNDLTWEEECRRESGF